MGDTSHLSMQDDTFCIFLRSCIMKCIEGDLLMLVKKTYPIKAKKEVSLNFSNIAMGRDTNPEKEVIRRYEMPYKKLFLFKRTLAKSISSIF